MAVIDELRRSVRADPHLILVVENRIVNFRLDERVRIHDAEANFLDKQ